ncbi:MAG: FAD-dependent monooxygenase [Rhodovarius sp.]|nr:FAD-dependent monooxygenase [Rhodovarius sp.]MDW8313869.1 FAD-dependent monooxygenase [Rhodovarius sp.]
MKPGRALIIGGSMGGLCAGLLLLRAGWRVMICERAEEELVGRGAGIVTHPELSATLAACGIAPADALGVPVAARRLINRAGETVLTVARPQVTTSWDRLFRLLRRAFPDALYARGRSLVAIERPEGPVRAHFADGSTEEAELLVAADGFRSTVRSLLLPEVAPAYVGYVGWRGLVPEAAMRPALHAALFEDMTFYLPPGEQILGYPAAGEQDDLTPGRRRYNFVWYRPVAAETELPRLLTGISGRRHSLSIPPPEISPAVIEELRADAERLLPWPFAELIALCPRPFLQPIYDLAVPRMAVGAVAFLGDAAFIARPHVGAGVSKAALDALALARALEQAADLPQALSAYHAERHPQGLRAVRQGQALGACIDAAGVGQPDPAARAAARNPAHLLAETATLDFLAR